MEQDASDLRGHPSPSPPPAIFHFHGWDDLCARTEGLTTPHSLAAFIEMMATHPSLHVGSVFWTIQTYAILRDQGLDVVFDGGACLPSHGVVIGHNHALLPRWHGLRPRHWLADRTLDVRRASEANLVVAIRADRRRPSPIADLHVVQNPNDPLIAQGIAHHIPHWPQFGLVPRDSSRADRFETLGFFGWRRHLAPTLQLPSCKRRLRAVGVDLRVIDQKSPQLWSDYREIDAVLAVRRFVKQPIETRKPASKLVNAWLAGVPAIVGVESAYRSEGSDGVDFLEVASFQGVLDAVARLRDPELRRTLVANGRDQARRFSCAAIAKRWEDFIWRVAIPRLKGRQNLGA